MLYAAHECARVVLEEGLDATTQRHRVAGAAMLAGVHGLGLGVFGDLEHRMHNVVAVQVPDGVVADAVRAAMLDDFAIEIGTSFGPLHGRVWRIGTMGVNARKDAVLTTLAALEHVLRGHGVAVPAGGGVSAAQAVYAAAQVDDAQVDDAQVDGTQVHGVQLHGVQVDDGRVDDTQVQSTQPAAAPDVEAAEPVGAE